MWRGSPREAAAERTKPPCLAVRAVSDDCGRAGVRSAAVMAIACAGGTGSGCHIDAGGGCASDGPSRVLLLRPLGDHSLPTPIKTDSALSGLGRHGGIPAQSPMLAGFVAMWAVFFAHDFD